MRITMMIKWALFPLFLLSCWRRFSIATAVDDDKKGSGDDHAGEQHRAFHVSSSSSSTSSSSLTTTTTTTMTMTNKGSITTMIATVVPPPDDEEEKTSENIKERSLQAPAPASPMAPSTSTTTETTSYDYVAAYTAQVQHISRDALCTGGRPEVRVLCGGDIRFVNATWPNSINCVSFAVDSESNVDWAEAGLVDTDRYRNGLHCTIDCESANECNLFTQDSPDPEWARAAQVNYECAGNAYNDIATLLVVTKAQSSSTPYTCPNDPDTTPSQGHYARLGVICESDAVSYDIFLFECVSPSFSVFTSNENTLDIGEQLVCATLGGCSINKDVCDCADTTNSCPVKVFDVGVLADIYQFPPSCVTTKAGVTVPAIPPTPPPVENNNNNANLVVTARFRANWSLYSDDAVTSSNRCKIDSTVALVECTRLGDTISLLEAAGSVTCTNNSDRALSCVDSAASFVGDYASFVDYECTGAPGSTGGVPATQVRLDPTSATCQGGGRTVRIGHAVNLGPFCDSTGFFYAQSLYVECQYGNQFYQPKVDELYRYSCAETVLFDGTTTTTTTMDIPSATIMTDQSWQDGYFPDCVRSMSATAATATPSSAPQAPVIAPVAVNDTTVVPKGIGDDSSKEQEAPVGLIVGVSVGAVLFLAVLVVLFCRKSPSSREAQDSSRVKDATSSERDVNDASHQTAGYHSGQGGGGGRDDDRYQGQYMGYAPAFTDTPPPTPYATVQVLPAEAIIDIPASARTDRAGALSKSLGQLANDHDDDGGDNRRASDGVVVGGGDGRYRHSTNSPGQQQQDVAVTFKDQVRSMVVDGHPMAGNSLFAPRMMAEERNTPAASDGRRYAYQQQAAATTSLEEENDRPSATFSSSGLSDANTRGSSDPSGIYPA